MMNQGRFSSFVFKHSRLVSLFFAFFLFFIATANAGTRGPRGYHCPTYLARLIIARGSSLPKEAVESVFKQGLSVEYKTGVKKGKLDRLRVATYNLYNYLHSTSIKDYSLDYLLKNDGWGPTTKKDWELEGIARAIKEVEPDVMVLQEIGSLKLLRYFSEQYLDGLYEPLLLPGNTNRGIEVGFLVRRDLPLKFELHSFRKMETEYLGESTKVFSRDFPVLVARKSNSDEPLFALGGVHLKSQGYFPEEDPHNVMLRALQVKSTLEIIDEVRAAFGEKLPFMVAGDFNTNIPTSDELIPLFERGFKDPLNALAAPGSPGRVTHTYHTKEVHSYAQLDSILFDFPGESHPLLDTGIYRYRDENGRIKALPRNIMQRLELPSDHYPVYADFQF